MNQPEYKVAAPEQPFRNLTDISLLYQRQSANYAYQSSPREADVAFTSREDRAYSQQQAQPKEVLKPQKWKSLVRITLWSLIILGGTIALALVAMQFNPSSLLLSTTDDAQISVTPGEISIENIQYDVKPIIDENTQKTDEDHQKIIVVGNVKNPGPLAIPLHNLQITAWGTCLPEESPNEHGLCQIRVWPYKWKQDLLQSGEQLPFKSAAKIPANLQVDQVHVDVTTN